MSAPDDPKQNRPPPSADLVPPDHPLHGVVWVNPERLGGAPCFHGTRVPVKNLYDYLRGGHSIEDFVDNFPGVTREPIDAVLEFADRQLTETLRADPPLPFPP